MPLVPCTDGVDDSSVLCRDDFMSTWVITYHDIHVHNAHYIMVSGISVWNICSEITPCVEIKAEEFESAELGGWLES